MKRVVIQVISTKLELEFAREQRRFFDWSSLNTITTFLINNSYDLCGKGVSLRINTLTLIARLLSFRNQNAITLTDNNTNKDFILSCLEIVTKLKYICVSDDVAILVKGIIRGLDAETQYDLICFLEYLAITGLHESVPFQYFWNSLDDGEVFPFDVPETTIYYDSENEVCLLTESDLSLLARLEKLCDLSPRLATK
jgi:predicted ribonuclease YlaK